MYVNLTRYFDYILILFLIRLMVRSSRMMLASPVYLQVNINNLTFKLNMYSLFFLGLPIFCFKYKNSWQTNKE